MDEDRQQIERVLDGYISELERHNYRLDRLSQGNFLIALDLQEYIAENDNVGSTELQNIISKTMDQQPSWVTEDLDNAQLPRGFANAASNRNVKSTDFADPAVDHEWLMYPGDDFFEVMVRQYYTAICGDRSLQSVTQKTKSNCRGARDVALNLISTMNITGLHIIPTIATVALRIVENNIDDVCDEYDPY